MKILLLLSRFENGGLERVQLNLGSEFVKLGLDTEIIAGKADREFQKQLPEGLPLTEIARKSPLLFLPRLVHLLRHKRPTHIITSANDVACISIILKRLLFPDLFVAVSQHLSLSEPINKSKGLKKLKLWLIKKAMSLLYPLADSVIAVSEGVANDLATQLKLSLSKIIIIYNPIIDDNFRKRLSFTDLSTVTAIHSPIVVFAGRLAAVKRLDLLLDAFADVLAQRPAHLLIIGSGPEENSIREQIAIRGWSDICTMTGFVENILPLLKRSKVLVLPSDFEGFGNVLVEAMACGIQVISTDCPSGPSEILDHGKYGQLVPTNNAKALAAAIQNTLANQFHIQAESLIQRADFFSSERAIKAYLSALRIPFPPNNHPLA